MEVNKVDNIKFISKNAFFQCSYHLLSMKNKPLKENFYLALT